MENFYEVLDLLIHRKDWLALEPFYRCIPSVKLYIDLPSKLKVLETTNFYFGFHIEIEEFIGART